ncbi:bifunctional hydroxymethylpyrimidine kinase/phosphomethylpyrimidine kinase [Pectinatus sottacetonis]|uniref:bifunctional hydroxymethylpyrimidine kinase/phosphomethylpyrimidine kinase n=1 Tax=Pectinatus sottacetonis TaxID=1002795 RepID=UPI0018C66C5E|nr:bifunctional hydroxymethylpyrimidine kinase/phosphomethylpyrimidine kinase [Pectinatus sottacetonis]
MKKILTIAGSDCSGGAGIQADIKTITAHRMYAMSVITALTAQNTNAVYKVMDIEPDFVAAQMDAVFSDIKPDAVKIGMVSNDAIVKIIARKLLQYNVSNIVIDPVMVATSGNKLLDENAVKSLCEFLLPLATVVTPNIPEASILCGFEPHNIDEMEKAAIVIMKKIFAQRQDKDYGVLIKGGHSDDNADDVLRDALVTYVYHSKRIDNPNTHGTGCTLSSAIACNLAGGMNLHDSINYAKKYVALLLKTRLDLGNGSGPLNHMAANTWIAKNILD